MGMNKFAEGGIFMGKQELAAEPEEFIVPHNLPIRIEGLDDIVRVVRCKDCKHYVNLLGKGKDYRCSIFCGCYDRPYPTDADNFCSYGERRTDA